MATKNQDGSISIEAWSLVEFLPEVIKAYDEGYVLDMEKNLGYPQQFGNLITITMFPKSVQDSPLSTKSEQVLVMDNSKLVLKVQDKVVGTITDLKVNGTIDGNGIIPSATEVTTPAAVQRGRPKSK